MEQLKRSEPFLFSRDSLDEHTWEPGVPSVMRWWDGRARSVGQRPIAMPFKDQMADLDEWPYIYCYDCRTVQPVMLVQNDEVTADLLCAICTRIMATLHKRQAHDRESGS